MVSFVAIDFETADNRRDSACSVGLVRVENGKIVDTYTRLIRPPRSQIIFSYIHGIKWKDVENEPAFPDVWIEISKFIGKAPYLAAHNASFDRSVLRACCNEFGCDDLQKPFLCTVKIARHAWDIRPTKLPDVCGRLGISLNHHDAASDALACAEIVLHATKAGHSIEVGLLH